MKSWRRTYTSFILVVLGALLFFSCGGYLFYNRVSRHFVEEVRIEQGMVADRITENIQLYLKRVRQTVTSVLAYVPAAGSDIKEFTARRFRLLQKICPEITHLAFLSNSGEVFYTGNEGDFMPLGLSLEDIYEWQHFDNRIWSKIKDNRLHQQLSVLLRYQPELDKVVPVPIIIFAQRAGKGEDSGLMLVPYQLNFMFESFCRSLVVENRREIVVVDNRGEVVFSSLPGLLQKHFYPAYGLASESVMERDEFMAAVEKRDLPRVVAALSNRKPFSTTVRIPSGDGFRSYLATFHSMELVAPGWTVMVATPRDKSNELAWQLLLPVIIACVLLILLIAVFSFFIFRRLDLFAQENAIFKAGLVTSLDGVMVLDVQGRYLFVNRAYCEIIGSSEEELLGTYFKINNDVVKGLPGNIFSLLEEHGSWRGVVSYRKIGENPMVEVSQTFSEIRQGGVRVGYLSNLNDISEERRLKREVEVYSEYLHKEVERQTEVVLQSQKMETIGVLAAGFAHDFNNLLASLHGNIELLEMMVASSPDKAGRYIEKIRKISTQAAELIRQILLFARRDVGATEIITVEELIEAVMVLVPPSMPAQISYDCLEDSCDLKLKVAKTAIVQSILNLVLNAEESFAEGQEDAWIKITAKAKFIDHYLSQRLNLAPDNWYCEITISDNGVGIAPAMLGRIFDPFFSTKEWSYSKGTGLGLAIVYRTITNHDGTITVNSELGSGTSFIIYLPVAGKVGKTPPVTARRDPSLNLKDRRILVVEDEELLRDSLKVLLELHGIKVELAAHGRQALQVLEKEFIDLIVLDLVMPEMGGEEFLEEMKKMNFKVPVLIMTGTLNEGFRISKQFPVVLEVLEKPFSRNDLIRACSRMLF